MAFQPCSSPRPRSPSCEAARLPSPSPRWSFLCQDGAKGVTHLETTAGLSTNTPHCLRLDLEDTASGRVGVANEGFWGIGLKAAASSQLTLHDRSGAGFAGSVSALLESADGKPCSETVRFNNLDAPRKPFKASLTATASDLKGRLVILAEGKGKVWLDWVSLMPRDTWKNHDLRPDCCGRFSTK